MLELHLCPRVQRCVLTNCQLEGGCSVTPAPCLTRRETRMTTSSLSAGIGVDCVLCKGSVQMVLLSIAWALSGWAAGGLAGI